MPKFSEVAKLIVNGREFEDWETVYVQHRWIDGWPIFRFTSAERAPLRSFFTELQFKPGDRCTILLGGQLAITGVILQRQTSYDAANHQVLLSGAGYTWGAATSSVESKDNNFDNMTVEQIARKVFGKLGATVEVIGTIDQTPFDRMQAQPGEPAFDFLDRIARMRGVRLGADISGKFLLIGEHSFGVEQQLTEGENILKMQAVFSNEQMATIYSTKAQKAVSDGEGPRAAAEMATEVKGTLTSVYKRIETVSEQNVKSMQELNKRAEFEAIFRESTILIAHVTVQGWLRDGLNLWRPGDNVSVKSPMAMINMVMKIQTVTFTQDVRTGTTTTLELVLPWRLGDKPYGTGVASQGPNIPQPPPSANVTSDAPPSDETPPNPAAP